MEAILQWLNDNLTTIIAGISIPTVLAIVYRLFVVRVIPTFLEKIKKIIVRVVANLFGVSADDGEDIVDKLPFIDKIQELSEELRLSNEQKLIDLKTKLSSPLYDELEKIPIQKAYNMLYNRLKDKLSPEVVELLEAIEKMGE